MREVFLLRRFQRASEIGNGVILCPAGNHRMGKNLPAGLPGPLQLIQHTTLFHLAQHGQHLSWFNVVNGALTDEGENVFGEVFQNVGSLSL